MPFESIRTYPIGSVYSVRASCGEKDEFKILEYTKVSKAKHLYLLQIINMASDGIVNPYTLGFWNYKSHKKPSVIGRKITLLVHRDGYVLDSADLFNTGRISEVGRAVVSKDAAMQSLLRTLSRR